MFISWAILCVSSQILSYVVACMFESLLPLIVTHICDLIPRLYPQRVAGIAQWVVFYFHLHKHRPIVWRPGAPIVIIAVQHSLYPFHFVFSEGTAIDCRLPPEVIICRSHRIDRCCIESWMISRVLWKLYEAIKRLWYVCVGVRGGGPLWVIFFRKWYIGHHAIG